MLWDAVRIGYVRAEAFLYSVFKSVAVAIDGIAARIVPVREPIQVVVDAIGAEHEAEPDEVERGIETGVHYPIPCHRQACYAGSWDGKPELTVSEAEAARTLSLPMFPEITPEQQERVVEELARAW